MGVNLKIIEDKYNPLLSRRELFVEATHDGLGTPSRLELRKTVAKLVGASVESTYIMGVKTKTGSNVTLFRAEVYDKPELAKSVLSRHLFIRNLPKEEKEKALKQMQEAKRKAKEAKVPERGRRGR